MNFRIFTLSLISCLLMICATSYAQPKNIEKPNPEAIAKQKTDKMNSELNLSEKQYKKVYKIFLQEENSRNKMFSQMAPPQGGGMPPQNMGDAQFPGRPEGMPNNKDNHEELAKKLKKILTEQQYDIWESLRAKEMMDKMILQ